MPQYDSLGKVYAWNLQPETQPQLSDPWQYVKERSLPVQGKLSSGYHGGALSKRNPGGYERWIPARRSDTRADRLNDFSRSRAPTRTRPFLNCTSRLNTHLDEFLKWLAQLHCAVRFRTMPLPYSLKLLVCHFGTTAV
jgi:hypothetical protein